MEFNLESVWRVVSILALVVSLGSAITVFMNSPGRKLEGALKDVKDSVDKQEKTTLEALKGHDRRIQAVEDEIKHLPTSDEFAELRVSLARVQGDVERIEGTLDRVDHVVQRIDDYLRTNR